MPDVPETRQGPGKLESFWLNSLPPMSGRLRLVFYVAVAYAFATIQWLALDVPEYVQGMPSVLYLPEGLVRAIGVWPSGHWLVVIRAFTVVAWVCAAAGLFWRASAIVTAVGFFLLYGAEWSYGTPHSGILPLFAFAGLCFSSCDDEWTADTHIARRWPGYWFRPPPRGTVSRSGFGRVLITVIASFTLFWGGVAKMRDAGLRWLDGVTILVNLGWYQHHSAHGTRIPWVTNLLLEHPWLCAVAAIFTIVVELGAPAALFSRRLRHSVFAGAALFHIGIYYFMGPNFWSFVATYMLLIDWGSLVPGWKPTSPAAVNARWPIAVGFSLLMALLTVGIFRIEAWPFTYVPMFSSYESTTVAGDVPLEQFGNADVVQQIATTCANGHCKYAFETALARRIAFRLAGDPSCAVPIDRARDIGGDDDRQWEKVTKFVLCHDLASKPAGNLGDTSRQDNEASRFLREVVPYLDKKKLAANPGCSRIEMTYLLDSGPVVIGSAPLGTDPDVPRAPQLPWR